MRMGTSPLAAQTGGSGSAPAAAAVKRARAARRRGIIGFTLTISILSAFAINPFNGERSPGGRRTRIVEAWLQDPRIAATVTARCGLRLADGSSMLVQLERPWKMVSGAGCSGHRGARDLDAVAPRPADRSAGRPRR